MHTGWSLTVVQGTFPGLEHESEVPEGFCAAGGANAGFAEGGAEGVGEDAGEEEAKCDGGGDSVELTHAKNPQRVSMACFL